MHQHTPLFRTVALVMTVMTVMVTTPISAADFSTKGVVGSVSAVGAVELRGITISQEGTLFAGDRVRAHEKAYAKITLLNGQKIELGANTDVVVNRDGQVVQLTMASGNLAFSALKPLPLNITVDPYEIGANQATAGSVAFMGDAIGIRAMKGKVTVRNLKTKESFVVNAGEERLLGLKNPTVRTPIAQMASALPAPIPAPRSAPAPQAPAGGMSTGAWVALLAAVSGGAAAIAAIAARQGKVDDEELTSLRAQLTDLTNRIAALAGLPGQITTLQGQVTGLQATASQLRSAITSIQNALALSLAAQQAQTNTAVISTTATEVQTAIQAANIPAATRTQLLAQAQLIISRANGARSNAASLQQQINELASNIASQGQATPAQLQQLEQLNQQLAAALKTANEVLQDLQDLASNAQAAGVATPSAPALGIITPPPFASASIPT